MAHAPFYRRRRTPTVAQLASGAYTAYSAYKDASDAVELASSAYQYLTGSNPAQNSPTEKKSIGVKKMTGSTMPGGAKVQLKGASRFKQATAVKCPDGTWKWAKPGKGRPRKVHKMPKAVAKEIKEIKSTINSNLSHYTYKTGATTTIKPTQGAVTYLELSPASVTNLQGALAYTEFFDPSNPATPITVNMASPLFQQNINVDSVYNRCHIRNNYQIPCKVKVYLCKPKGDSAITPATTFSDGVNNQVINGSTASLDLYPTEIDLVNKIWSMKVLKSITLNPGQEFTVSHTEKDIKYDPSLFDSVADAYQKRFKSFTFFVRVQGCLGHDTTTPFYAGITEAGVDCEILRVYKVSYEAGIACKPKLYISDSRPAIATPVIANKPVSDNQAYSVA